MGISSALATAESKAADASRIQRHLGMRCNLRSSEKLNLTGHSYDREYQFSVVLQVFSWLREDFCLETSLLVLLYVLRLCLRHVFDAVHSGDGDAAGPSDRPTATPCKTEEKQKRLPFASCVRRF